MNRLHRLILFLLIFLQASFLNAQEEKQDSVGTEQRKVMSMVTDGLVTGVRYTEEKIKHAVALGSDTKITAHICSSVLR